MTVEVRKNIIHYSLVDAIIACPDPDRVYPRHLPHMIDMSWKWYYYYDYYYHMIDMRRKWEAMSDAAAPTHYDVMINREGTSYFILKSADTNRIPLTFK